MKGVGIHVFGEKKNDDHATEGENRGGGRKMNGQH